MFHDPAISSDDLTQDYSVPGNRKPNSVSISTYVRRRKIDADRRYTRRCAAARNLPSPVVVSPLNRLILEERQRLIARALRRATPSQRRIARLLMNGLRPCEIALRLCVLPSAVAHTKRRLRPLLVHAA